MKIKKTGLFVGRFQPFHIAHLSDIKNALKLVNELIIVIGSSQDSRTNENPLSAEERKAMIEDVLKTEKIKGCRIFSLNDINNDDEWVSHVEKNMPAFDVVFSGNPRVINLFRKAGYDVMEIKLIEGINGTLIREKIASGKRWKDLVPESVARYIAQSDTKLFSQNI